MNEIIGIFILCISFLYLMEGIYILIHKKSNKVYKITHVLYPLFMFVGMTYFLSIGFIK